MGPTGLGGAGAGRGGATNVSGVVAGGRGPRPRAWDRLEGWSEKVVLDH
jgi:hypothetical protein